MCGTKMHNIYAVHHCAHGNERNERTNRLLCEFSALEVRVCLSVWLCVCVSECVGLHVQMCVLGPAVNEFVFRFRNVRRSGGQQQLEK